MFVPVIIPSQESRDRIERDARSEKFNEFLKRSGEFDTLVVTKWTEDHSAEEVMLVNPITKEVLIYNVIINIWTRKASLP